MFAIDIWTVALLTLSASFFRLPICLALSLGLRCCALAMLKWPQLW